MKVATTTGGYFFYICRYKYFDLKLSTKKEPDLENQEGQKEIISAPLLASTVLKGLDGAGAGFSAVAVRDESALVSFLATIARLEQYRLTLVQAMCSSTGKAIEEVVTLAQKVSEGVVFHNLAAGVLTKEDAASYLDNPELMSILVSAEEKWRKGNAASTPQTALGDLTKYMSRKKRD